MRSPEACDGSLDRVPPQFCTARGCSACLQVSVAVQSGRRAAKQAALRALAGGEGRQRSLGVAVVDSDEADRQMMEATLSASKEFQPCGFFTSAREALTAVPSLEVQIVVVEVALPDLCGIRCARELMARRPGLMVVSLGAPGDPNLVEHALAAGVQHYLVKPVLPWQYVATLRCVWALRHAQAPARVPRDASASPSTTVTRPCPCPVQEPLTEREQQVMACLADGCIYKAIERHLQLSEATVKRLQHRAYQKLQANNRTIAIEHWRHWVAADRRLHLLGSQGMPA